MASYNTGTFCPGKQTDKQVEPRNVTEIDIFSFFFSFFAVFKDKMAREIDKLLNFIDYRRGL